MNHDIVFVSFKELLRLISKALSVVRRRESWQVKRSFLAHEIKEVRVNMFARGFLDFADTDIKQARCAFELRYWSALATVKYGSPQIRKGGSNVLTTGVAGRRPHGGWVIAASVCGTIEALTRALRCS